MKHKTFSVVALLTLMSTGVFAAETDFGALGAKDKTGLTLEQMLTYAIQDEYLARSEYAAIMERYGELRPFSNIVRAEEQHIRWLTELARSHDLTLAEDASKDHVAIPENLRSAFETGVQAEVDNIAMYRAFLGDAALSPLPADVRVVFERLMAASKNHLKAFENNLSRYN